MLIRCARRENRAILLGMLPLDLHPLFLDSVDSTNRYALERIDELPHHSLIIADIQTAGRGRLDRSWHSHIRGNLYMSLVEKPDPGSLSGSPTDGPTGVQADGLSGSQAGGSPMGNVPAAPPGTGNFTQLMAVAATAACASFGIDAALKWPNDLVVRNSGRGNPGAEGTGAPANRAGRPRPLKFGGILGEAKYAGSRLAGLVIGLGINIEGAPELGADARYRACSLRRLEGRVPERLELVHRICTEYLARYELFLQQGFASIRYEYLALLDMSGSTRRIRVDQGDGIIEADFHDIGPGGELVLRLADGQIYPIYTGDCTWIP